MNILKPTLSILLFSSFLSTPLLAEEVKDNPVSLTVNNESVDDVLFRTYYRLQAQKNKKLLDVDNKEIRVAIMNQLVNIMLLSDAAKENKLDDVDITHAKLRIFQFEVLAQAEIARVLKENPVTEEQIKSAYDRQYAEAPRKEYHVRHILVSEKSALDKAYEALNAGTPFAEVATQHSTDSSKNSGGDIGWLSTDDLGPSLSSAIVTLEKGNYSKQGIESEFGWHILLVEDERTIPNPPMSEVYETLKTTLQQQVMANYMQSLRDKSDIKYTGTTISNKPLESIQ